MFWNDGKHDWSWGLKEALLEEVPAIDEKGARGKGWRRERERRLAEAGRLRMTLVFKDAQQVWGPTVVCLRGNAELRRWTDAKRLDMKTGSCGWTTEKVHMTSSAFLGEKEKKKKKNVVRFRFAHYFLFVSAQILSVRLSDSSCRCHYFQDVSLWTKWWNVYFVVLSRRSEIKQTLDCTGKGGVPAVYLQSFPPNILHTERVRITEHRRTDQFSTSCSSLLLHRP